MKHVLRYSFSLFALLLIVSISLMGFGCRSVNKINKSGEKQELVVWGLWQESSTIEPIIKAFNEQYGVKVKYKKIASVATYEKDLLSALAEGRGPDVFVIHHAWVSKRQGILSPAPTDVIDARAVKEEFVDVVSQDLVKEGKVYALPVSVDTLAMYYNKDILNAAGIARPPETWTDFQSMVEKITKVNRLGTIQQSAAALGAAANINRAPDILQLLILQSGLPIYDTSHNKIDINNDIGKRAMTFYSDFANKAKKVYTWNLQQDYSVDAFAEGETAVMFNYSYHIPTIKAKNSRLNFGIAPMPQISGSSDNKKINFAAYWPYGVSSSSSNKDMAWKFVRFITGANSSLAIDKAQGTPPARRDNVVQLQRDSELGVFAEQSLSATSWLREDIAATDAIFNTTIDNVILGASTISDGLKRAEDQLNKLMQE